MDQSTIPVLVDAKVEYTKQLTSILKPFLYDGIKSIYEEAQKLSETKTKTSQTGELLQFQHLLSDIPKWTDDIVQGEVDRIMTQSKCDWLEDLITAVFVSHTKVLISIQTTKTKKKINLQIPKIDNFIHHCYIESARIFWKNPYLFSDTVSHCEYQRNMRDCETIISNCICETIRKLLPVKYILQEYLGEDATEYSEEEDFSQSLQQPNQLKMLVQKEIEHFQETSTSEPNPTEIANPTEITESTTETVPAPAPAPETNTTTPLSDSNAPTLNSSEVTPLSDSSAPTLNSSEVVPEINASGNVSKVTSTGVGQKAFSSKNTIVNVIKLDEHSQASPSNQIQNPPSEPVQKQKHVSIQEPIQEPVQESSIDQNIPITEINLDHIIVDEANPLEEVDIFQVNPSTS